MECEEEIVDPRIPDAEAAKTGVKNAQALFTLNHTMPMTAEYDEAVKALFGENIGEGTRLTSPLSGVCFERVKIGRNVYIGANLLTMARGGITIEDGAWIAANVQVHCCAMPRVFLRKTRKTSPVYRCEFASCKLGKLA